MYRHVKLIRVCSFLHGSCQTWVEAIGTFLPYDMRKYVVAAVPCAVQQVESLLEAALCRSAGLQHELLTEHLQYTRHSVRDLGLALTFYV